MLWRSTTHKTTVNRRTADATHSFGRDTFFCALHKSFFPSFSAVTWWTRSSTFLADLKVPVNDQAGTDETNRYLNTNTNKGQQATGVAHQSKVRGRLERQVEIMGRT